MKRIRGMAAVATALALLLAVAGCSMKGGQTSSAVSQSSSAAEAPAADETEYESFVKVLCYNVFYQNVEPRQADITGYIKALAPDVMGLQETTAEWRSYINAALVDTGEYGFYGFSRTGVDWADEKSPTDGKEFNVILYRQDKYELLDKGHFWCSTTPNVFSAQIEGGIISETPRCINWVQLKDKSTGGEFVFLDAHLDAYNEQVKNFSAKLIVDQMKSMSKKVPVIMVGDWNSQMSSPAIQYFLSNGYDNTRNVADETTQLGTYHDFQKRDQDSWMFGDIILVNKGKTYVKKFDVLTDAQKDGKYFSDHHPITAEIYY